MSPSTSEVGSVSLVRRRSREALSALAVVFLLGMAVNLFTDPGDDSTASRVIGFTLLGLHVLLAIGVIVVAVRVRIAAGREGAGQRVALWALVVVVVTFLFGVGTVLTDSEWLSFLMAAGFLAAGGLYTALLVSAPGTGAAAR